MPRSWREAVRRRLAQMVGGADPPADELNDLKEQTAPGILQREQELAEHQRTEEALAKRTAELEDARSFLDSVLDNLPVMLFVKDAKDLRFVRWNRAEEEGLGIDRAAAIGKSDYDFFPEQQARFFEAKDRAVLTGGRMVDIPE